MSLKVKPGWQRRSDSDYTTSPPPRQWRGMARDARHDRPSRSRWVIEMEPLEIAPAGLQTGPDRPPALPISAPKTSRVLRQTFQRCADDNPPIVRRYEL